MASRPTSSTGRAGPRPGHPHPPGDPAPGPAPAPAGQRGHHAVAAVGAGRHRPEGSAHPGRAGRLRERAAPVHHPHRGQPRGDRSMVERTDYGRRTDGSALVQITRRRRTEYDSAPSAASAGRLRWPAGWPPRRPTTWLRARRRMLAAFAGCWTRSSAWRAIRRPPTDLAPDRQRLARSSKRERSAAAAGAGGAGGAGGRPECAAGAAGAPRASGGGEPGGRGDKVPDGSRRRPGRWRPAGAEGRSTAGGAEVAADHAVFRVPRRSPLPALAQLSVSSASMRAHSAASSGPA